MFVSGLVGSVASVTVTLSNLSHSFPEDLDIVLVSPGGQKVLLLSDAGASVAINNVTLTFNDTATGMVPSGSAMASGTFRPSNYPPARRFQRQSGGPLRHQSGRVQRLQPQWHRALYVFDDVPGDSGRLAGGWSLALTTFDPINPHAELSVTASDAPDPVQVGSNVTYTVTVANDGPEVALAFVLTNLLPAGVAFVSATTIQGVCSSYLGRGRSRTGHARRQQHRGRHARRNGHRSGIETFTARVSGGVADFNPANDTASITTFIEATDSIVVLSSFPKTVADRSTNVSVTNRGPNAASGVTVTNILPAGVTFVAATGAACVESGGIVTCDFGPIAIGDSAIAVISVTTPGAVAPLTNVAFVTAASPPDPDLANNQATLVVNNLNPSFVIEAAMTFLVSESGPITDGMEPGETVSINFMLRNLGQQPTVNLVATLLALGGVHAPGGRRITASSTRLELRSAGTNTFTVSANPGPVLTATLQDGPFDLGTVEFTFPVGGTTRFTQSAPILTPGFGKSSPYPSTPTSPV